MASMSDKHKKQMRERSCIEKTRQLYPWFPPGDVVPGDDPPDFCVDLGDERIAIEETRLFHPRGASAFPRRQIETFHRKVMRRAEQRSVQEHLPPQDVLACFSDRWPLQDAESAAGFLVGFVRTHPVEDCETFGLPGGGRIRIMRPRANKIPRWTCNEGGTEPVLDYQLLAQTITRKSAGLPRYRARYERAWLLVATQLFPLSASFCVPRDIEHWRFEFDFDKVLLLSPQDGKVFSLLRC